MLSIPGVGEAMFSITSLAHDRRNIMEFSIKKCGCLTELAASDGRRPADHHSRPLRQRLSRWRPSFKGKDLLFIAGGIGLAPLRSVINYVPGQPRELRQDRHRVRLPLARTIWWTIDEIQNEWMKPKNGIDVHLTIDRAQEGWDGHVGFVPTYVKELGFDPNKTVLVCGPPIMIKFVLQALDGAGLRARRRSTPPWSCA